MVKHDKTRCVVCYSKAASHLEGSIGNPFAKVSSIIKIVEAFHKLMSESLPAQILVERAREGDTLAFEKLFLSTNAQIYNFLLSFGLSMDEADDLCQETYVRAWTRLPSLKADERFISWLHTIARNLVKDSFKHKARRPEISQEDQERDYVSLEKTPHQVAEARALSSEVWDSIVKLPEAQRLPVVMRHIEGLSITDIAQALRVPMGTVLSRLARGRAQLARRLSTFFDYKEKEDNETHVLQD